MVSLLSFPAEYVQKGINLCRKRNQMAFESMNNVGPLNKVSFTFMITSSNNSWPIDLLTGQVTSLMSCLRGFYDYFTSLRLNYN